MSGSHPLAMLEEADRAVVDAASIDPQLASRLARVHGQQLADWALEAFPVTNLYVMDDGEFYKVGFASDIKTRRHGIQNGNPRTVVCLVTRKSPPWGERLVHDCIRDLHVRGEWFRRDSRVLEAFERSVPVVPRRASIAMVLDIMVAWSASQLRCRRTVEAAGVRGWFPGVNKMHHTDGCNRADFYPPAQDDVAHLPRCAKCVHIRMQNLAQRSRITRTLLQRALSVSVESPSGGL